MDILNNTLPSSTQEPSLSPGEDSSKPRKRRSSHTTAWEGTVAHGGGGHDCDKQTLFIKGLSSNCSKQELLDLLLPYGTVHQLIIEKGGTLVTMEKSSANMVLKKLNKVKTPGGDTRGLLIGYCHRNP
ncbi:uncharacterized protein [Dysidea avara]|uniref:uncharacterized protein n=1 Tax=Dysidea avara TaxID=196820 RepID=UPI00331A9A43